jgi:hypothetical protein
MLDPAQWLSAVAQAGRAPSPHNAQPARWLLRGDQVQLFGAGSGWLAAGDPAGRDDLVALGMAWEAMSIALSTAGSALARPTLAASANDRSASALRLVAQGALLGAGSADPLAGWQSQRRSYRGRFAPASRAQRSELDAGLELFADTAMPLEESAQPRIARWYDAAAAEGLRDGAVASELYRFMRFSRRHPGWTRDGLAADCMMLGGVEAWAASWLMRPAVLSVLGRLRLTAALVSEKPKVLSATRIVMIHGAAGESPFETGRRWYRFWLALTAAGFSGVPMSALADSPGYSAELLAAQPLPAGQRLVNVMRVGPAPAILAARSARLPPAELLLTAASGIP